MKWNEKCGEGKKHQDTFGMAVDAQAFECAHRFKISEPNPTPQAKAAPKCRLRSNFQTPFSQFPIDSTFSTVFDQEITPHHEASSKLRLLPGSSGQAFVGLFARLTFTQTTSSCRFFFLQWSIIDPP